jgi:transcriptional regulator with XRE-family HTH domain
MTFAEELGMNLAAARESKDLSTRELAQKIGVTTACISNWEYGRRMPNAKKLSLLCSILEVNVDDILPEAKYVPVTSVGQTTIFEVIGE